MISGLVYFDEIIEGIKDESGIENLYPYYDKIRRWILRSEYDIAPSGLVVQKKRTYTIGDGYYDGTTLLLPYDFVGEYSYAKLNSVTFRGNHLELTDPPGSTDVDLFYMGLLLDQYGNPPTTRNHLEAVITFIMIRLYAPRVFLGKGNRNILNDYKRDYDNLVLASRGNDAFGTEEDFAELGRILRSSAKDLMTECVGVPVDPFSPAEDTDSSDCGNLTVDMVAVYEAAKID